MDYRSLLKNVEKTLTAIEQRDDILATIVTVGEAVVHNFRAELGIYGGRLYVRRENEYVLERGFGRSRKVPAGLAVTATYEPIRRAEEDGLSVTDLSDPSVDRELERKLRVNRFAVISFGEQRYLLSFDVHPRVRVDDLLISLGIIRTVVDSKVRTGRLEGLINDARRIQQSILPRAVPTVGDYDVAAVSVPAEIVGGDFYDFLPLSPESFGVAVADASGHGLLAALLVRDVYVGLRMGIGGDLKIARAIERLNRILNKSRLATKFVSLWYGEFESNGEIIYVNAGHTPPIHYHASAASFSELDSTGMVLGPSPTASYGRRAIKMEPGDVLLLHTDGITEAHDPKGRELGTERVKRVLHELRKRPAAEICERLMQLARQWGTTPPEDDQTAIVIRRAKPVKGSSGTFPKVTPTPAPPAAG